MEIAGVDVKWFTERQVNKMIRGNTSYLELKVVTPIVSFRNFSVFLLKRKLKENGSKTSSIFLNSIVSISQTTIATSTSTSTVHSTVSSRSAESDKRTKKKHNDHKFSSWNLFRRSQSLGKLFWQEQLKYRKYSSDLATSSR